MRRLVLIFLVCSAYLPSPGQDVIVLRKDESEMRCKIVSANDSLVTYKLWNSADTTIYTLKRYEVLSFAMGKQSQRKGKVVVEMPGDNPDDGILGLYHSGETVEGWVLNTAGDTIRGFITVVNPAINQVQVRFKGKSGIDTVYGTSALKSYGYGNVVYDRIRTCYRKKLTTGVSARDGIQFVHRGIDGPSRLYRFYTLKFSNAVVSSYNGNPPMHTGVVNRKFLVTSPDGNMLFSKGRTLAGMMNRIYLDYKGYAIPLHLRNPTAATLPEVVDDFNQWYSTAGKKNQP
jgi:hypothetical protein